MDTCNEVMNFEIQWTVLKDRKKDDDPDVPKITKALPIIKRTEAFQDFLHQSIGVRMIPLVYVICANICIPGPPPQITVNQPHSDEHGSVEADLVACSFHHHGTTFTSRKPPEEQLMPHQSNHMSSVRMEEMWMGLSNQFAGDDKWEAEIKKQDDLLHTSIGKGQSSFPLEGYIAQHRNAYVSMRQYQFSNLHTHLGYLLEGIQYPVPGLQVAMASIHTDNGLQGMYNKFKTTAALLPQYASVNIKRTTSTRHPTAQISALEGDSAEIAHTIGKKPSIGKSGVHLHYHTNLEYHELTAEPIRQLIEWRESNPNFKHSKSGKNTRGKLKLCPTNN